MSINQWLMRLSNKTYIHQRTPILNVKGEQGYKKEKTMMLMRG